MTANSASLSAASLAELHAGFLSILPRIQTHARIYFRQLPSPVNRAEAIAETIALSWKWYRRLAEQGKDARKFPSALASFAARAVRSGRRVCGQVKAKDVLSPLAQQRHGFVVNKLPDFATLSGNPLAEALQDNRRSSVPDQVAFRLDFPSWLTRRTQRERRLITDMGRGERTMKLARKYGVSPARISQLRRHYRRDWEQFCSETPSVPGRVSRHADREKGGQQTQIAPGYE